MIHFSSYTNKNRSDLSKNLVFYPASPRPAKLWALKVCPAWDSNPGRLENSGLLYKFAKNVALNPKGLNFFLTPNFDRS